MYLKVVARQLHDVNKNKSQRILKKKFIFTFFYPLEYIEICAPRWCAYPLESVGCSGGQDYKM